MTAAGLAGIATVAVDEYRDGCGDRSIRFISDEAYKSACELNSTIILKETSGSQYTAKVGARIFVGILIHFLP